MLRRACNHRSCDAVDHQRPYGASAGLPERYGARDAWGDSPGRWKFEGVIFSLSRRKREPARPAINFELTAY